ncbi:MAG: AraC family transcriptional regulator [Hyphomicrobiales bacterium]
MSREILADYTNSFRVGSSFSLPRVIEALGHSSDAVFASANVDPALYRAPENRIAAQDLGRLFLRAAQATGREDIGLLVVDGFKPAGLGLVGLVAAEGPDVNTALKNLVRLLRYNTLAGYPALHIAETIATMKFELRNADFPGSEYILEGATGIILRFIQWLGGPEWKADEIHLSRRRPADPQPFEKFFLYPIRFSATEDGVLFPAAWLKRRVPQEEDRIRSEQIAIGAAPFSELVRRQAAMGLGFEPLTGQDIAAQIGMSRRQLFRNLKAEGATCQKVVDEVRFARARHLLAAGDAPIAEIAFAVGYPDQTSFTRAFARWAGVSPGAWRRRASQ